MSWVWMVLDNLYLGIYLMFLILMGGGYVEEGFWMMKVIFEEGFREGVWVRVRNLYLKMDFLVDLS